MWANRHVVLGVTGGIACYKSCHLVRRLIELGATGDVGLSQGAAEDAQPRTVEALSGRPVITSVGELGRALPPVRLGQEPALVIVAPATAHLIARVAQGMADDF